MGAFEVTSLCVTVYEQQDNWKVRVVTFDLDDTLWPTIGVVLGANAALQNYLSEHHPKMKSESSAIQLCCSRGTAIFRSLEDGRGLPLAHRYLTAHNVVCNSTIRDDVAMIKTVRRENEENIPGYRVYYAQLREAAIGRLALEGSYDEETTKAIASTGYKVWLQARQDNADKLLFSDAVATLEALKKKGFLIGAITNGAGDPRQVKSLAEFFDLYVSSEQPDVMRPKPDAAPFEMAIKRAAAQLKLNEEDVTKG
eukprot:6936798-Pyramimonas_sp.AAC.2